MSIPSRASGNGRINDARDEPPQAAKYQIEGGSGLPSPNLSILDTLNGSLANSARKQRHHPDLNRPVASPSQSDRIWKLYQDAAMELHRRPPLRTQASPNSKRSRLPLMQARNTRFGQLGTSVRSPYSYRSPPKYPQYASPGENHDIEGPVEPFSSGYAARMTRPDAWNLADDCSADQVYSSSPPEQQKADTSSEDGEGGIPLPLFRADADHGETNHADIDAWLTGLEGAQDPKTSLLRVAGLDSSVPFSKPTATRTSSSKENISPTYRLSPPHPPVTYSAISTPSRFRIPSRHRIISQTPKTPTRFAHPSTPHGHLSLPPKRRQRLPTAPPSTPVPVYHSASSSDNSDPHKKGIIVYPSLKPDPPPFAIHEDADCRLSPPPQPPPAIPNNVNVRDVASTSPAPAPKNFTVSSSHIPAALLTLSPAVSIRRRRRRARWDTDTVPKPTENCTLDVPEVQGSDDRDTDIDLFPEGKTKRIKKKKSGRMDGGGKGGKGGAKERKVLAELEVAKEKAFMDEAEDWDFEFSALLDE
ncbi:uncharacterized protein KY384_001127 [Bacidia gigantensis]|uniref:uncharacterized protein n=1 Tax=Bacidia gigantensis TaxID=2732470 RepID=UPI001D03E7AB|nr:uncharacterized protein KY384_001127 [Bacidia gigantensis]KAG8534283.1 hypothetical protein KY384_001127 [Bacidia gigantensis]